MSAIRKRSTARVLCMAFLLAISVSVCPLGSAWALGEEEAVEILAVDVEEAGGVDEVCDEAASMQKEIVDNQENGAESTGSSSSDVQDDEAIEPEIEEDSVAIPDSSNSVVKNDSIAEGKEIESASEKSIDVQDLSLSAASSETASQLKVQSGAMASDSANDLKTQVSGNIADGAYVIKAKVSYGGQALGVKNALGVNSAVQVYGANGNYDQIFYFQLASGNRYAIFSLYSGLALTVSNSSIVQAAYSGGANQLFEVRSTAGGLYALISQSGKAVASPNANANAVAQGYTGALTQRFNLVQAPLVIPGVSTLRSAAYTGATVGSKNGSAAQGADSQLTNGVSGINSRVLVSISGSGYAVRPLSSGLYLAPSGTTVKQQYSPYAWNVAFSNSGNRRGWSLSNGATGGYAQAAAVGSPITMSKAFSGNTGSFLPAGSPIVDNGYYVITASDGRAVDVSNGSYAAQANVQVYQRNGTGAQVFYIQHIGNGLYLIVSSKTYQALDAQNGGTGNNTNIWQYPENRTAAQLWIPTLDTTGKLIFINAKSGLALTMAGSNVTIYNPNGSAVQRWALVPTKQYSFSGITSLDKAVASILAWHPSLKSAFDYVAYNFNYRNGNKHWSGWALSDATSKEYALDMWNHWSGNCYRFASMFAWCARALGYTNVVVRTGWVVGYSAPQAPHGWVTVNGYICDPDMQHEAPSRNWYWQTWASAPTAYYDW